MPRRDDALRNEPMSACCGAPVYMGVKRGRKNDLVPDNECTDCGADLDIMDLRYDEVTYPSDADE